MYIVEVHSGLRGSFICAGVSPAHIDLGNLYEKKRWSDRRFHVYVFTFTFLRCTFSATKADARQCV